jgi:tRNA(fMet)-specific endonuclease VapC
VILYALDTDSLSLFERRNSRLIARILATPPDQLFITAITVRERLDGWYGLLNRMKSPSDEERVYARLIEAVKICASLRILPYTAAAISRFQQLQSLKLNVGPMDLRIAAIALEQNATVVTCNVRDFSRIPDLVFEDWTQTTG